MVAGVGFRRAECFLPAVLSLERLTPTVKRSDCVGEYCAGPDPEMAEGGRPGRWGRDDERQANGARIGDFAAAGQPLPALRSRSLRRPLATAQVQGRHHHRRLSIREPRPALLGRDAREVRGVCAVAASQATSHAANRDLRARHGASGASPLRKILVTRCACCSIIASVSSSSMPVPSRRLHSPNAIATNSDAISKASSSKAT